MLLSLTKMSALSVFPQYVLVLKQYCALSNFSTVKDCCIVFSTFIQLRSIPVQKADDVELEEEATWIYHKAFCSLPVSQQPHYSMNVSSNAKPASSVAKIKETVNFFRNFSFEVPFIAIYRREYIEPELGVHDLWKIWSWDEKVCAKHSTYTIHVKCNLLNL